MESNYLDCPKERRYLTPENAMLATAIVSVIIGVIIICLSYYFLNRAEIKWLPAYSKYIIPLLIGVIEIIYYWHLFFRGRRRKIILE